MKARRTPLFFWGIAALTALRLWHFGSEIDAPHDWRQCDTACYIRGFYQNRIDLLHPVVCWMGRKDTLVLEFPLPEAVVALAYRATGEYVPLARLIFLCYFAGALFYFYRISDLLFGVQTARLATLVYLALPLSIFYSRAIHIDFSAVLLAHAMLYYYLTGVAERRWEYLLLSSLAAALAAVIKAPYAFCFLLPMVFFAIQQRAFWWTARAGAFYLLALGSFWLWQQHVSLVNGAAPNLDYILHYRKMTQSAGWYFGTLEQRLSLYPWWILLQRGVLEVAGAGGIVFFLLGWQNLNRMPNVRFFLFWILGLAAYVLIFFNLNFVHNYYQIPLLAPMAILCARGLQKAASGKPGRLYFFFGLLVAANVAYTEIFYYKIAADHVEIGRMIRENTPDSVLVIVTYKNMDCRDPRILYRTGRRGWSVEETALRPEVIERLHKEEGAQFWVYAGPALPELQMHGYLASLPSPQAFDLTSASDKLYIFDLREKNGVDPDFVSHIIDPAKGSIEFFWKNANGENFENFQNLKQALEKENRELIFAMNGGMFKEDLSPQGLYVENGKLLTETDTIQNGYGNFYLQPNGVFYLTNDNEPFICKTTDFAFSGNIKYATQSGPLLLINGDIHPKFVQGSNNLNIRNGVGILPDGKLLFAMSKEKINFYDFAGFFKAHGCKNALYLDGFVSKTYLPSDNWVQSGGAFGVIVAETRKKE